MKKIIEDKFLRQFVKFGIIGFLSFLIDSLFYLLLTRVFLFYYLTAKAISFIIAATNSYYFNRRWTFRSSNNQIGREFVKFLIVATIGLGINTLMMYIMVDKVHLYDLIALVIATAIVMFWNFTVNKFWTFKTKPENSGTIKV